MSVHHEPGSPHHLEPNITDEMVAAQRQRIDESFEDVSRGIEALHLRIAELSNSETLWRSEWQQITDTAADLKGQLDAHQSLLAKLAAGATIPANNPAQWTGSGWHWSGIPLEFSEARLVWEALRAKMAMPPQ